ncbi:MAG: glutathione S-transferase family protein [Verrucomicrobiota bacterium]
MSVVLYQMPHSPYAIPIRQALTACGAMHETRDVPNWDRGEVIRLTEGAYYQIPLLLHEDRVVFETGKDSLDVARYIDANWAGGRLFPEKLAAPNLCLTHWIEDALEGCTFKLADIHYIPAIEDIVARTMVVRHKERKFGKGCLEQWRRDAGIIRSELDGLLSRCESTLKNSPFLLGATPVYADFALFGVLGNLTYGGWNRLSQDQIALQSFVERLSIWRFGGG